MYIMYLKWAIVYMTYQDSKHGLKTAQTIAPAETACPVETVKITPAMIEAGEYALMDFGPSEDLCATDPALVVQAVFLAMLGASSPSRERAA